MGSLSFLSGSRTPFHFDRSSSPSNVPAAAFGRSPSSTAGSCASVDGPKTRRYLGPSRRSSTSGRDPTRPWSPLGAARGAGSPRNSVNVPSRCYFSRIVPGPSASERQGGVSGSSRPSSAWRCPKRSWWDAHAPTWTASCTSERRSLASPTPCGAESPTLGEARRYPASRDTAIRERNGSSRTPCVVGAGAVNLESPAWRSTSHSPVRHRRRGGRRNADPAFSRSTIGSRGHPAAHPWNRGSLSERPLPVSSSHGGLRTADKA